MAAIATVTLGACTTPTNPQSTKLKGEAGEVQAVVVDFSTRAIDEDAKGICSTILSPAAIERLAKGGDCAAAVKKLIDATDLTTLDVDAVKITGTTAVATIVRTKKATRETQIVLEQAAAGKPWKIAAFGNAAAKAATASATTPSTTPDATTPKATTPSTTPAAK